MKEQFENFVLENNPDADLSIGLDGNYVDQGVHVAWIGYKAVFIVSDDTTIVSKNN